MNPPGYWEQEAKIAEREIERLRMEIERLRDQAWTASRNADYWYDCACRLAAGTPPRNPVTDEFLRNKPERMIGVTDSAKKLGDTPDERDEQLIEELAIHLGEMRAEIERQSAKGEQ